jgi:hypothetical protein
VVLGLAKVAFCRRATRERQARRFASDLLLVGAGLPFWLFTIYDKDEMSDLTKAQCEMLKQMIKSELEARSKQ